MNQAMKTNVTAVEAGIYEPPRMTMVPIRTSGSLLVGSAVGMMASPQYQWELVDYLDFSSSRNEEAGIGADATFEDDWGQTFW